MASGPSKSIIILAAVCLGISLSIFQSSKQVNKKNFGLVHISDTNGRFVRESLMNNVMAIVEQNKRNGQSLFTSEIQDVRMATGANFSEIPYREQSDIQGAVEDENVKATVENGQNLEDSRYKATEDEENKSSNSLSEHTKTLQDSSVQQNDIEGIPFSACQKDIAAKDLRIVYNRVPKCGSTTLQEIIKLLAEQNNFSHVVSSIYDRHNLTLEQQNNLVNQISKLDTPVVFDRHVFYLNFTSFHASQPIYINLVREPLERLVSHYYYISFNKGHFIENVTDERRNRTYDQCVQMGLPECVHPYSYYYVVPFFCGHDSFCRKPSARSLAFAKYNLVKNFCVVGILEEMELFLTAIEKLFPDIFKGALQTYKKKGDVNKTVKKVELQQDTITIMDSLLTEETDFYQFAKQYFHQSMKTIYNVLSE